MTDVDYAKLGAQEVNALLNEDALGEASLASEIDAAVRRGTWERMTPEEKASVNASIAESKAISAGCFGTTNASILESRLVSAGR